MDASTLVAAAASLVLSGGVVISHRGKGWSIRTLLLLLLVIALFTSAARWTLLDLTGRTPHPAEQYGVILTLTIMGIVSFLYVVVCIVWTITPLILVRKPLGDDEARLRLYSHFWPKRRRTVTKIENALDTYNAILSKGIEANEQAATEAEEVAAFDNIAGALKRQARKIKYLAQDLNEVTLPAIGGLVSEARRERDPLILAQKRQDAVSVLDDMPNKRTRLETLRTNNDLLGQRTRKLSKAAQEFDRAISVYGRSVDLEEGYARELINLLDRKKRT